MNAIDVLRDFAEELRDRAATAYRSADTYASSGYRGEALLIEERGRAFDAAALLVEDKANRIEKDQAAAMVEIWRREHEAFRKQLEEGK